MIMEELETMEYLHSLHTLGGRLREREGDRSRDREIDRERE